MMLGYPLARVGVSTIVLEKHADFLRDFRGDTVHPSTMQVLADVGLLEKFEQLPQRRVDQLGVMISGRLHDLVDFRRLKPFDHLSLVPQWDFLDLLATEGRRLPNFDLRMRHEAVGLVEEQGRIEGVRAKSPEGNYDIRADIVVACDGRGSTLRDAAGFHAVDYGAPMDVLWFRLPRVGDDPEDTFAILGAGHMMVLLNRNDYWQAAYFVPKGSDTALRGRPIEELLASVSTMAPLLADCTDSIISWDDVKTLEVRVNRLQRWHRPGFLVIGDAAHAMSPIGGVGINLAIQDAVAAANELAPALLSGDVIDEALLGRIQKRRQLPTKLTQAVQLQVQKRLISAVLAPSSEPPQIPALLRWLLGFQRVRRVPARLIGYGFRRERVRESLALS